MRYVNVTYTWGGRTEVARGALAPFDLFCTRSGATTPGHQKKARRLAQKHKQNGVPGVHKVLQLSTHTHTHKIVVVELCEALKNNLVPRGLEPRTLRLLAVRSNQLSYETLDAKCGRAFSHGQGGCGSGMQCSICQVHAS